MKQGSQGACPAARKSGVLVHHLHDEVVVYDLERHLGHCLNRPAALVWAACDGKTPVSAIAARVSGELGEPVDEAFVWFSLRKLETARLLEAPLQATSAARISRRELAKRLGFVAGLSVLLPTVASIVAPTAAQAANTYCTSAACNRGGRALRGCCCTNVSPRRVCVQVGSSGNNQCARSAICT